MSASYSAEDRAFLKGIGRVHQPETRMATADPEEHILSNSSEFNAHREELLAMFDAYLGTGYDRKKIESVLAAQAHLHVLQQNLAKLLHLRQLSRECYVDQFNQTLMLTFRACESILGEEDFGKLFGGRAEEMGGFIDKGVFLAKTDEALESEGSPHANAPSRAQRSRRNLDSAPSERTTNVIRLLARRTGASIGGRVPGPSDTQETGRRPESEEEGSRGDVQLSKTELALALARSHKFIKVAHWEEFKVVRITLAVKPVPCFTLELLDELSQLFSDIELHRSQIRHLVVASEGDRIFSFGVDLELMVSLVRSNDLDRLQYYGRRCTELISWLLGAAENGIQTTALVQGDVFGGAIGFLLPFHTVICEESVRGGFPEALFDHFASFASWNLLCWKLNAKLASELILGSHMYTAKELVDFGVFDVLARDGSGESAVWTQFKRSNYRQSTELEIRRAAAQLGPISRDQLIAASDAWAQSALRLTERSLTMIRRLRSAQSKDAGIEEFGAQKHNVRALGSRKEGAKPNP